MSLLLAAGSRNRKRSPGTAFLSTTFAESSPGGGTSTRCSTVPVPVPSGELGANVHREGRHWGLRLTRILARSRKITVSHALRTFREGLIRTIVGRPVLTCTIVGRPVLIRKNVASLGTGTVPVCCVQLYSCRILIEISTTQVRVADDARNVTGGAQAGEPQSAGAA